MSLLFNMLSRLVITSLPRSKCLLISWLQSPSAVILEPKNIKSATVSTVSPSICHEVMGRDAMILVFWMLSFKPTFSLSSFTFIMRLFSSSSLSAITLTLLTFSSVQLLSRVRLFASPWTAACQASLSITNSQSLPKPMSIESVMPPNYLILCRPLLLLPSIFPSIRVYAAAATAAKSFQSCPTLCDPMDSSPPGPLVPGILQARTLEWVAISFSNAWKWKVKVKSLCRVRLLATPWPAAHQAPLSMGFSRQEYWSGVPLPSPIRVYSIL